MRLKAKIFIASAFALLLAAGCGQQHREEPSTKWVDPFIGTDGPGNTYPGAAYPFGMVQLSPDNGLPGWDRIAGYFYPDSTINGFSHTHLSGTGAGDMYDISFFPVVGDMPIAEPPLGLYAKFNHAEEEAHAGYYKVLLHPSEVVVELTALSRVGVQRYTFRKACDTAYVKLDLARALNWDRRVSSSLSYQEGELSGHRFSDGWARDQRVYFSSRFSREADSVRIDGDSIACLYYSVRPGDQIEVYTALSGVSVDGARGNLQAEVSQGETFDQLYERNQQAWRDKLALIEVKTQDAVERTKFYTALYHAMLCPTLLSDADGRYLGADREVHQLKGDTLRYSTFSLWDTYRSAHPLYNMILPKESRNMAYSLECFGYENGWRLPVWNMWSSETNMMIGYHSAPVIVDAILKGIYTPRRDDLLAELFTNTVMPPTDKGLTAYSERGYIPLEVEEESVSKTLEYSYDDSAIRDWAKAKGYKTLYEIFAQRASSYKNLWDQESQFFRPRHQDGSWLSPFDPYDYSKHYTESNAYQYLFALHQDVDSVMAMMGGKEAMAALLDGFFSSETPSHIELPIFSTGMIGQYVQGNEPSHHAAILYNKVDQPWKLAEILKKVCDTLYTDKPDGLCGNEDCGQMSAWYVFVSLGLYPLNPVDGRYEILPPRFSKSKINLSGGKFLEIEAIGANDPNNTYIARASFNGSELKRSFITWDEIQKGGKLVIELTGKPGIVWYQ